jgi:hypothetical protein
VIVLPVSGRMVIGDVDGNQLLIDLFKASKNQPHREQFWKGEREMAVAHFLRQFMERIEGSPYGSFFDPQTVEANIRERLGSRPILKTYDDDFVGVFDPAIEECVSIHEAPGDAWAALHVLLANRGLTP